VGTNQAFGGSGSANWNRVREEWAGLGSGDSGIGAGGNPDEPTADPPGLSEEKAYDALLAAIAQALMGEDKDARRPAVPSVPLSAVLPRRGRGGGTGGGGGSGGTGAGGSSSGVCTVIQDEDEGVIRGEHVRV